MMLCSALIAAVAAISLGGWLQQGTASGPVTGAAAGGTSIDGTITRCAESLGTIAIEDGREQAW
ncbi:hypothetical protein ACFQX4_00865 [Roseomonas sp. GCM10028921]